MSIPDYQTLMLPVLAAASHGEVGIGELVDQLGEQLGLTPEERTALLPSGRQTIFSNRVHLMIRHNVGCRVEHTLYIKKLDEDFFD
jgi:restriction endonuclease Mrr